MGFYEHYGDCDSGIVSTIGHHDQVAFRYSELLRQQTIIVNGHVRTCTGKALGSRFRSLGVWVHWGPWAMPAPHSAPFWMNRQRSL